MNTPNYEDNHSLTLNLSLQSSPNKQTTTTTTTTSHKQSTLFSGPSLTLTLSGESKEDAYDVSSLSVKRERETGSSDEFDVFETGLSCRGSDEDDDGTGCGINNINNNNNNNNNINNDNNGIRKKLRLNKQQSAMLEDSFKHQSTLNPKQKQALAERLNLRPRQVEVWFQNRRARTKLKQTEVDCEYLKKYCETLTDENKRLEKELQELKVLKGSVPPFYMHLPAATLTMCPSCERVGGGGVAAAVSKNAFSAGPKTHHFLAAAAPNRPLLVDN